MKIIGWVRTLFFGLPLVALFLAACGSGEGTVDNKAQASTTVMVLNIGDVRTVEFNVDKSDSYDVQLYATQDDTVIEYVTDYAPVSRPRVEITGVKAGNATLNVRTVNPSGEEEEAELQVLVLADALADQYPDDIITTSGTSGTTTSTTTTTTTTTTTNSSSGGSTGLPGVPPDLDVGTPGEYDEVACRDDLAGFETVSDVWNTTEGTFSSDDTAYVRTNIYAGDTRVTLYYIYNSNAKPYEMASLGQYPITLDDTLYSFELQMGQAYLDGRNFYVKIRGKCLRGTFPSSVLVMPDRTLTLVTNEYLEQER